MSTRRGTDTCQLAQQGLTEGNLELFKLPTIWTDQKQRWEESEKRREEKKKEDEKRENLRRKKIQVHEKVGRSQNTMFFQ